MSEEISISNEINFSARNDNFAATSQKKKYRLTDSKISDPLK